MMDYVLALFAIYRVARMLALEDGPGGVFHAWRSWTWRVVRGRSDHWLWRGANCPACLSFWLSWPIALLLPWPSWAWYVVTALALSGAATALYKQERS